MEAAAKSLQGSGMPRSSRIPRSPHQPGCLNTEIGVSFGAKRVSHLLRNPQLIEGELAPRRRPATSPLDLK
jgi:hypothetical protein